MRALQIRASVLIAVVALSQPLVAADVVIEWNQRANASVLEAKTYPFAGTRVMAIVHTAMFDAINSIEGQYTPYLHDTLLQSFQGVIRHLHALTFILDRPAEVSEKLEGLLEMGSRAIIEGRDAVQGMRSSTVVNNDLAGAFAKVGERLAAEQNAQNPVNFRVLVEGKSRNLHPILRDEVYRIASEATRNSFQHSGATRIDVEICMATGSFECASKTTEEGLIRSFWRAMGVGGTLAWPECANAPNLGAAN